MDVPYLQDVDHVPGGPRVVTIATQTGTVRPKPPRRLNQMVDVRKAIADVCRALEADELEPKRAAAMIDAYKALGALIEKKDLEHLKTRLAELRERKAKEARAVAGAALATTPPP